MDLDQNFFMYNGLGQVKTVIGRNEAEHDCTFDVLGRKMSDAMSFINSDVASGEQEERHVR